MIVRPTSSGLVYYSSVNLQFAKLELHAYIRNVMVVPYIHIYTYVIITLALSGLFELYTRGGYLNHMAKPSGLNMRLERTVQ